MVDESKWLSQTILFKSPHLSQAFPSHLSCFRQAAQPIALRTALSTAFPATSLHLAHEILSLMLLVDHFQSCGQLKDHLITSLVLWADVCSPVLWEGKDSCRVGLWHTGTALGHGNGHSCPTLLRPGGLATLRGFRFGSPLWEGIQLCWEQSVLVLELLASSTVSGTVRQQGKGAGPAICLSPCEHNVLSSLGPLLPLPETQWGGTGGNCRMYSFSSASHQS